MNAAGCDETGCRDVHDVVRARKLRAWAESDVKFLRKLSVMKYYDLGNSERLSSLVTERSESFQRFACRQRFLRSYPFDKEKEGNTFVQKTKNWTKKMMKPKEKAMNNPCSPVKSCVKCFLSCTTRLDVHDP